MRVAATLLACLVPFLAFAIHVVFAIAFLVLVFRGISRFD